jgi:hypothetical protein
MGQKGETPGQAQGAGTEHEDTDQDERQEAAAPNAGAQDDSEREPDEGDAGFDRERAMATIRRLRDEERKAKNLKAERDRLKARVGELEGAQLSEKEKAERDRDEAVKRAERAEKAARRAVVEAHAVRLGFVDPADAHAFLADGDLEVDAESGLPTNVDAALKAVLKRKPYLAAAKAEGQGEAKGKEGEGEAKPTPQPGQQGAVTATPKPKDAAALGEAEREAARQETAALARAFL